MHLSLQHKSTKLFMVLSSFFVANALIAECIGSKIFSLERVFGFQPLNATLFGQKGISFNLTCGVLLWPLEFIMTDIINDFFGPKGVRRVSYIAVGLIGYAFLMFFLSIQLPPADFWYTAYANQGVPNVAPAFNAIFGQGMWIILGSLTAFLVSQVVDVTVFHWIKRRTGEKWFWLRGTGSTVVSQMIDSFLVLYIAFYWGQGWSIDKVLAICLFNYSYKFLAAWVLTPVMYFIHHRIEKYLGHELATEMKNAAMGKKQE
jgi:uncharacterized integral membrane protein (TIGR00697 family)